MKGVVRASIIRCRCLKHDSITMKPKPLGVVSWGVDIFVDVCLLIEIKVVNRPGICLPIHCVNAPNAVSAVNTALMKMV